MEVSIMKWLRRISSSISLSLVGIILTTFIALAVPASITDLIGVPTDTTIKLTWTMAASSNSTLIKYSTTTYPATTADGTTAYNGTASYTTVSSLTAGTPYYFSAWGYDGSDYSASAANLLIVTQPSATGNATLPYTKPTIPANATADPDTSGWSISPIDDIIAYFADPTAAHGGLGMPTDNLIMFMAGVAVSGMSITAYIKWRSFGAAWFIAFVLSSVFSLIGIMQWIVVGLLFIIGMGVWAIDKSTQ